MPEREQDMLQALVQLYEACEDHYKASETFRVIVKQTPIADAMARVRGAWGDAPR